jgi:YCII-related domain
VGNSVPGASLPGIVGPVGSCPLGRLIFNEGYSAEIAGAELSREAIRLGRLLLDLLQEPEVMGLLGLMLLQESRRAARTSPDGDLILTALTLYWKNGKVATTDGPYAETKEQLGGILILEARDLNHAIQLISQVPGFKYGLGPIEIRPAADSSEVMKASEQRRRQNAAR